MSSNKSGAGHYGVVTSQLGKGFLINYYIRNDDVAMKTHQSAFHQRMSGSHASSFYIWSTSDGLVIIDCVNNTVAFLVDFVFQI